MINDFFRDAEMRQWMDFTQQWYVCSLPKLEYGARLQIPWKQDVTNQGPRLHRTVLPVILKKKDKLSHILSLRLCNPISKVQVIWFLPADHSLTESLSVCKYFNQWLYSMVMLTTMHQKETTWSQLKAYKFKDGHLKETSLWFVFVLPKKHIP